MIERHVASTNLIKSCLHQLWRSSLPPEFLNAATSTFEGGYTHGTFYSRVDIDACSLFSRSMVHRYVFQVRELAHLIICPSDIFMAVEHSQREPQARSMTVE